MHASCKKTETFSEFWHQKMSRVLFLQTACLTIEKISYRKYYPDFSIGRFCPNKKNRDRKNAILSYILVTRIFFTRSARFFVYRVLKTAPHAAVFFLEFCRCRRLRSGRNYSPFASLLPLHKRGRFQTFLSGVRGSFPPKS